MIVTAILVTSNGNTSIQSAEFPTRDSNDTPVTSMIQSGLDPSQDQEVPMGYIMNPGLEGNPMTLALLEPLPIQDWDTPSILADSFEFGGEIPLDILTPPRQPKWLPMLPMLPEAPEPPPSTPEPSSLLVLALGTLGMIPAMKQVRCK